MKTFRDFATVQVHPSCSSKGVASVVLSRNHEAEATKSGQPGRCYVSPLLVDHLDVQKTTTTAREIREKRAEGRRDRSIKPQELTQVLEISDLFHLFLSLAALPNPLKKTCEETSEVCTTYSDNKKLTSSAPSRENLRVEPFDGEIVEENSHLASATSSLLGNKDVLTMKEGIMGSQTN